MTTTTTTLWYPSLGRKRAGSSIYVYKYNIIPYTQPAATDDRPRRDSNFFLRLTIAFV